MSLYHIVFAFLLLGVLIEYNKGETPKWYFCISFLVLSLMMALRFGQGTDYYSYCSIYTTMPLDIQGILTYDFADAEIGWRVLCAVFKMLGFSFKGFVLVLSVFEMLALWKYLSCYCKNHMLALFLGYHTLYLTYFFSAMRQALVIAIFLGVLLEWLLQGKLFRYCIVAIACSLLHSVSWVLLIPVVLQLIRLSFTQMVCLVAVGFLFGVIFSIFNVGQLLIGSGLANIAEAYLGESSISVAALLERMLTFIFVTYACYIYFDGEEPDQGNQIFKLYKIYSLSMLLYGFLMWSPLISSRAVYMFKIIEIPLLCFCITKCKKAKSMILLYCIFISSVLYYKNIGSYISQGMYLDFNVVNYPYVSVFDLEKIAEYRKDTGFRIYWLEFDFDQAHIDELIVTYQSLSQ